MANRLPRQFFSNCLSLEKEASALRLDSVGTDRSSRLRLNTYSSSVRPVRGFRAAICRILAPWGCGTRRLRNRHAGFPPTIHSRGRWLRDLGGSRSSDAGTCRRGGSSRAWPLSRKMGKKGKVTPDASAAIQERQAALFASEAPSIESGVRSPPGRRRDGNGIGVRLGGAVAGTGLQFASTVKPRWRPGSFQKSA